MALSSTNPAASTPTQVEVPAGATSASFTVTTIPVTSSAAGCITGKLGVIRKAALTVRPIGVAKVTLSPTVVVGPATVTGTVTLEAPVPASVGTSVAAIKASANGAGASASLTVKP